ncbi:hypothetical protein [Thermosporothrix hazakensis]|jgi:anti-sigma factor ChrR (cupin superfamily)|nr:hypothetical protein [Thermosporothrix hazakensis]BBH89348.1 hypothetical protein KTC_40990 [Thermosporothrix sp. COM3]GCE47530.1 hypothetical protein KTH_23990 [Thermosporothrix hazakensis]
MEVVLDGTPLPANVARHVAHCPLCQSTLAQYEELHFKLLSRLYRSQCPSSLQLGFFCAGLLSGAESEAIASHVAQCPLCSLEVLQTQEFLHDVEQIR